MRTDKYQEAIAYLYGLQRFGIKFGLENIGQVLQAIDNPHRNLPTVHISGSNGKGSTAAHLESILLEAGYRVGLYTSPHFSNFTERIRVNREQISEEDVVRWTNGILDALPELRAEVPTGGSILITFFEFTTAMAMAYFVEQRVDVAILEVGMGGRLDATNVCNPMISIITTVSLEHKEILGNSIAEIAAEKAGIIKVDVPVISGVSHPVARGVIENVSRQRRATIYRLGREFRVRGRPGRFSYEGIKIAMKGCQTALRGRHQLRNAALALAATEMLDAGQFRVSERAMREGLKDVQWRGRQEWLPGPPQILLDGAHNPEAFRSLFSSLRRDYRYEKLWVLMGIMRDKDHRRMIRTIAPLVHGFVFSRPRMDRSQDPVILKAWADHLGCRAVVVEDVPAGIQTVLEQAAAEDLVCVTGSLFVVGEVMEWLGKNHLQGSCSLS
jgi:dihydrofolate synthase/folylpolyglutamate synthase